MANKQDIAVIFNEETGERDIGLGDDGDLASVDDFTTSLSNSILVNRRADGSEVPQALDRRGWIGDLVPRVIGRKVGSKVWLYEQSRRTQDTINGVRDAVYEGLRWLVVDGKSDNLRVTAEAFGQGGVRVIAEVTVGDNVIKRYFNFWDNTEEGQF